MRILLIEDERALSAAICACLAREHFAVDAAYTGSDGLSLARSGIYDAAIVDVMLPEMDGFSILAALRAEGSALPVLMLTARAGLEDRIKGLDLGADYYLPKPFQMTELIACLRAITRRRHDAPMMEPAFAGLRLHPAQAMLACETTGKSIALGAKEYQLTELFLRNPQQILPRERIIERVWGYDSEAEYNNLEVYVSFVRKKLAFVGAKVRIRAVRGVGYTLEEAP